MSRIDRVNQTMKREIGRMIQRELKDPRLEFVTITRVDVSRDLHQARVYFSVLGDETRAEEARTGLNNARGMIRKLVGKNIRMRYTPDLEFIYDHSIEFSARIEKTLEELENEKNIRQQNNPKQ